MSCTAALYGTLGMLNFSLVITQGMQSLPICAAQQASGLILACASTPAKPRTPSPPPATSLFATSTPPRLCYWLLPGLTTLQQGCILHYFPPEPSKPIATQTLLVSGAASQEDWCGWHTEQQAQQAGQRELWYGQWRKSRNFKIHRL